MKVVDRMEGAALRSWLDEGVDVAPESAVLAALSQVESTRQRRELSLARRIRLMEVITRRRQQPAWTTALGALAVVVVLAIGAYALYQEQLPDVEAPRIGFSPLEASALVSALNAPGDASTGTGGVTGEEAAVALTTATGVDGWDELDGLIHISGTSWMGADGDPRHYAAGALVFDQVDNASAAVDAIRLRADPGGEVNPGQRWFSVPWIDAESQDFRDQGFGALGSFASFGGTSAESGSRAGMLLIWRVDNLVLVSVGSDWGTQPSDALQAEIEAGANQIADQLNELSD